MENFRQKINNETKVKWTKTFLDTNIFSLFSTFGMIMAMAFCHGKTLISWLKSTPNFNVEVNWRRKFMIVGRQFLKNGGIS
uniref:Uncharacterized protein n=1 Tax=Tetranychus urticae TaxID=32264 RepID=T1KC12_TETUR